MKKTRAVFSKKEKRYLFLGTQALCSGTHVPLTSWPGTVTHSPAPPWRA
jgi:hypothetical protein